MCGAKCRTELKQLVGDLPAAVKELYSPIYPDDLHYVEVKDEPLELENMDDEETSNTCNASGSVYVKFGAGMLKHQKIKQENLHEEMAPISEETEVKDEPLHQSSEYDQFNDNKDDGEISKIEEIKCPEAYPWQTIKTENEDMSVISDIDIKDEPLLPASDDNEENSADPKTTETHDLELHQLDNANVGSEMQHSACPTNLSTAPNSCLPRHPPNVLQCQHCDYTTTYSSALKDHSRKHTGDMLQCQHCDFTTAYSRSLKTHSRKHTGDKFQCEHCEYTAAHLKTLKAHSRKHTGDMLHCEHCEYTTAHSNALKAHSRKHTGDMLQCEHCEYTTTRSNDLKAHFRKHTGDMLHCQHCDYKTTRSHNLKAHSRRHTGDKL